MYKKYGIVQILTKTREFVEMRNKINGNFRISIVRVIF